MLIYLASPYSNPDTAIRNRNYMKISYVAAKMVANGDSVYSPITYGHHLLAFHELPTDWEFWKKFCLDFLVKCDKLIVCKMEGWDKSVGVAEEIKFAKENGIPIEYIEYTELKV